MQSIKHALKKFYGLLFPSHISTPQAIILAALLLSLSHIAYGFVIRGATSQAATASQVFAGRPIDESDLVTGKKDGDVFVVEYSDTECPFCAQLHPTLEQIKDEYAGKVGFVYRYFPLTNIHPNAFDEARALFCVGKIAGAEKREAYINEIFSYKLTKQNMTLPKNGKEDLAKNIGIDGKALASCLESQESGAAVSASLDDGVAAGVEGTPATFVLVKNKDKYDVVSLVSGAQSYAYFKAAIDEALSR